MNISELRSKYFLDEIGHIKSRVIQNVVIAFLDDKVPNYFWEIAASTSGKYHPDYALGEGGLARHTKAAAKIAITLFDINKFHDTEEDIILASILIHDTFKCGSQIEYLEVPHTKFEHPLYSANQFKKFVYDVFSKQIQVDGDAGFWWVNKIAECVSSHMGQWNYDSHAPAIDLPIPQNELQKFVHMCDYLASRKFIEIKDL